MTTLKTSLHGFCKMYQLPKTSVSRRAKEIGINTSNGLTQEDCDRLMEEFDVKVTSQPEPEPEVITVELVEETAISIANPLDSYSPLTAYQSQTWSHTDTSEIVEAGKNALANLTFNSLNNQNIGIAALLEHERNEGAKLGVALAQVKLGTANQVKDEVISEYLKKHGLSIA